MESQNSRNQNNEKSSFSYTYSAPTKEERLQIESIRRQYTEKSAAESDVERLRRLHAYVVNSATAFSLVIGIIGTLIFGLGMTCVLEWGRLALGVILGAIGAVPMAIAYPIYKLILARNKKKHGEEILRLSDALLGNEE